MLSNAIFVGDPSTHSDVALTTNGQTWSWTGVWTRLHPGTAPTSLDGSAFAYDATTGQVVVFGGIGLNGRANGLYDQTWTWDGSDWSLRGGSTAPAVTIPVPSPVSVPPVLPCPTLPASPSKVPQPQYACAGSVPSSTGGGSGSATGASGSELRAPGSSRPEPPQWLAMGDLDDVRIETLEDHQNAQVRAMLVDLALGEQRHFDHPRGDRPNS